MKSIIHILLGVIALTMIPSCGNKTKDAILYNDKIVEEQSRIVRAENRLIEAVSNEQTEQIQPAYQAFVAQIKESLKAIEEIESFDKQDNFKKAALRLFSLYLKVAESDYAEAIKLAQIPYENLSEQDKTRFSELSDKVDKVLGDEIKIFIKAQEEFAAQYKFDFKESESTTATE